MNAPLIKKSNKQGFKSKNKKLLLALKQIYFSGQRCKTHYTLGTFSFDLFCLKQKSGIKIMPHPLKQPNKYKKNLKQIECLRQNGFHVYCLTKDELKKMKEIFWPID